MTVFDQIIDLMAQDVSAQVKQGKMTKQQAIATYSHLGPEFISLILKHL